MFEKTTEIINKATPDSFLYLLEEIMLDRVAGYYVHDIDSYCDWAFTLKNPYESAKEAGEDWWNDSYDEERLQDEQKGVRGERWNLHMFTNDTLEEFKNSIIEDERKKGNLYTEDEYKSWLNGFEEDDEDPYLQPTENFIKSWSAHNLIKYLEYNNIEHWEGIYDECEVPSVFKYKNFYIVDAEDGEVYFGSQEHEELEEYTPVEDVIEKFNYIFNSLNPRENCKPDTYAYETKGIEMTDRGYNDWTSNEVWEDHLMFLDDEKLEEARAVFLAFCSDIDFDYTQYKYTDKTIFEADRFELFALTDEMINEFFGGASFSEIRDKITDLDDCKHYYTYEESLEEFFETDEFWFAFNGRTEEIFFGKTVTTLKEYTVEHNHDEDDEDDDSVDC